MAIAEIEAKGVRGIRDKITIPLNGSSLLIHGDNGTGKSSIERALRWVLLGTEAPTDTEPFSDETSFRRHILEPTDSPRVKITLTNKGFIEVAHSGVTADQGGGAFRDACIKGNPFLRRSEILSFLLSRPVDRFTYLETFLDLAVIDQISVRYSDETVRYETQLGSIKNKSEAVLRSMSDRMPQQIRPQVLNWKAFENSCLKYAFTLSLLDPTQTHVWSDVESAGQKAKALSEGDELEKNRSRLLDAQNAINDFINKHLPSALPNIGDLYRKSEVLKGSSEDAPISELLSHARRHLDGSSTQICPVCGKTMDRGEVLGALVQRLKNLEAYQKAEAQVRAAVSAWRLVLTHFISTSAKIATGLKVKSVADIDQSLQTPTGFDLFESVERETDSDKILVQILAVGPDKIFKWMNTATQAATAGVTKELCALPAQSALGDLRVFASLIEEASQKHKPLIQLQSELLRLGSRMTVVKAVSEALRRARQDVAKDTMSSISDTVAVYYEAIHPSDQPHEATGAPRLKIQRHGKGTAFVQGKFAGQDVLDPNWVYSDGHLDTVGICVFLALRRFRGNQAGDSKLMVFDDVVLSIDLPHARRLINLLKKEFKDHQLIILTHNGLFAHWCSKLLPGLRRLTINGWTLERGPQLGEYLSAMELVEKAIADQSAKQIALQVMALMDEWLTECRYIYALAVPAKPDEQYTLTDIWEPFASTLKKLGRALSSDIGGAVVLVDELRDLPSVRNTLGAHENEFAREFPRSAMVEIATKVLALVHSLYCPKCGGFAAPVPNRFDPSIIHCDCHCLQYLKLNPETK